VHHLELDGQPLGIAQDTGALDQGVYAEFMLGINF
jgi:hypothetical protein